jgi:hypothetical protein
MKATRATFPAPEPRQSFTGADLESNPTVDFTNGTLNGFVARFVEVNPDGSAPRIISTAFSAPFTPEEWAQVVAACSAAIVRCGAIPEGSTWSTPEVP